MSNFNLKQINLIKERKNLFLVIVFLLIVLNKKDNGWLSLDDFKDTGDSWL